MAIKAAPLIQVYNRILYNHVDLSIIQYEEKNLQLNKK